MAASPDDPLLLVLAADPAVVHAKAFRAAIAQGIPAALEGRLVTFGMTPTAPETGYGYRADPQPDGFGLNLVRRFVEKPSRERAQAFLAHGGSVGTAASFCFMPV